MELARAGNLKSGVMLERPQEGLDQGCRGLRLVAQEEEELEWETRHGPACPLCHLLQILVHHALSLPSSLAASLHHFLNSILARP